MATKSGWVAVYLFRDEEDLFEIVQYWDCNGVSVPAPSMAFVRESETGLIQAISWEDNLSADGPALEPRTRSLAEASSLEVPELEKTLNRYLLDFLRCLEGYEGLDIDADSN